MTTQTQQTETGIETGGRVLQGKVTFRVYAYREHRRGGLLGTYRRPNGRVSYPVVLVRFKTTDPKVYKIGKLDADGKTHKATLLNRDQWQHIDVSGDRPRDGKDLKSFLGLVCEIRQQRDRDLDVREQQITLSEELVKLINTGWHADPSNAPDIEYQSERQITRGEATLVVEARYLRDGKWHKKGDHRQTWGEPYPGQARIERNQVVAYHDFIDALDLRLRCLFENNGRLIKD